MRKTSREQTSTFKPDIKVEQCRICHSKRILPLDTIKKFYLINLEKSVQLSYKLCLNCNFIFQGEFVGEKFLTEYYKKSPMLVRNNPSESEIKQYKQQSKFISNHIYLKKLTALEIGADTGGFLEFLRSNYSCEVYFSELNEGARKVMLSKGLKDHLASKSKKQVELIILRHILEHIFDLENFLYYVRTNLVTGGYIFIEVPDWSYWDEHTDPLIFEHINQFNTLNLIQLLNNHGFVCEAIEKNIDKKYFNSPNRIMRILAKKNFHQKLSNRAIIRTFQDFYENNYGKIGRALNEKLSALNPDDRVAFYPASHQTFMSIAESDLSQTNVVGIFDIDLKKIGKTVFNIRIRNADQLAKTNPDVIFLLTSGAYELEIIKYLKSLKLKSKIITMVDLQNTI